MGAAVANLSDSELFNAYLDAAGPIKQEFARYAEKMPPIENALDAKLAVTVVYYSAYARALFRFKEMFSDGLPLPEIEKRLADLSEQCQQFFSDLQTLAKAELTRQKNGRA